MLSPMRFVSCFLICGAALFAPLSLAFAQESGRLGGLVGRLDPAQGQHVSGDRQVDRRRLDARHLGFAGVERGDDPLADHRLAAIDDPRPSIPAQQIFDELRKKMTAPLPEPAVWRHHHPAT